MGNEIQFRGYHRANDNQAHRIRTLGTFPVSRRQKNDFRNRLWLGEGVYFWLTMEDAEWWNDERYDHSFIFSADIICDQSKFRDLDIPDEMDALEKFAIQCEEELKKEGRQISFKNKNEYQEKMCDFYKKSKGILLLKYSEPKVQRNYLGFYVDRPRAQICATNSTIIHSITKEKEIQK